MSTGPAKSSDPYMVAAASTSTNGGAAAGMNSKGNALFATSTKNNGGAYLNEKQAHIEAHTAPAQGRPAAKATPGGDFMSNEDIRAYCEDGRKKARQRAVERALDAQMLEGRLRNIPDVNGSMSGARARSRRVTRWLKRVAQAEKMTAKWYAALYSAFEREYDAELMKIGRGRAQQKPHSRFNWR